MIYKCPMCREFFSERADLFMHQKIHTAEKPHKCDKCDKGFFHLSELHIHWRDHTGEKAYKCDDCGKDFSTTTKLNRHKKIHTVEKPYKCYECGKAFNWSSHLQIHMRVHTGSQGMLMLGPWGPVDHTLRAADFHDDLEREVTTCVGETELIVWREKQNHHQLLRRSPE
ncbi:zinc finger protein 664 isoform X3 [Tursiops truncatus]|uniref:zinc finger protein 664 isoform X3 n=1 Tax=Tursiops truncatus TaxID=9739 RepID=UPI003CCF9D46